MTKCHHGVGEIDAVGVLGFALGIASGLAEPVISGVVGQETMNSVRLSQQ